MKIAQIEANLQKFVQSFLMRTDKIIGRAIEVYKAMGNDFPSAAKSL
jgi:hypothetical protein